MNYTAIFEALILLIITIISGVVIPYIKEKIGNEKYQKIESWVKTAVEASDMINKTKEGAEKKEWVINKLEGIFAEHNINLTYEELDAFIESAVKQLRIQEAK